jgi:hypothetical protein
VTDPREPRHCTVPEDEAVALAHGEANGEMFVDWDRIGTEARARWREPQPARPPVTPGPPVSDNYLRAALEREAAVVASAPEGVRNNTLNSAVYTLARLRDRGLDDEVIVRVMVAAAIDAGLPEREARSTVRSALRGRRAP